MLDTSYLQNQIVQANTRIRKYIRFTYLERSNIPIGIQNHHVWFKLENLQITGSFKIRGALNKLLSMNKDFLSKGVVAASTGNHGSAVARAASITKTKAIVFVPTNASEEKLGKISTRGAQIRKIGSDCVESEYAARAFAESHGMEYISPYNDIMVIAGQGTIGIEIAEQLPHIDAVIASIGGGGLISGIGASLKSINPEIKIIGCSPKNSAVMIESIKAGKILDIPSLPTLSDSTAGGVEKGSITFDLCRILVDEFVTVSEKEIISAIKLFLKHHNMLIEGAAGVALACYLKILNKLKTKNVVIILCGANISSSKLTDILCN